MNYNTIMPSESVKVVVRMRPMNSSELSRGNQKIIEMDLKNSQATITNPKSESPKTFAYDAVYDDSCSQQFIYDETAFPLVESVIQGYNGTIFAYGQTGCGKTFTMLGVPDDPKLMGIIPNSFKHIFSCISEAEHNQCFLVRCSYCEIYNEEIRDLLNYDPNLKLELKESQDKGIYVKNLSMETVKSIQDIEKAMEKGNSHRITKATKMNERSSRSHAIFTIYIESSQEIQTKQTIKAGKLNLVDLAGSERQKKTGATGDCLKEAIKINLSLSALGNVISALVDGNVKHVPYRDSKLTKLLQDSLGGNTKTVMIAVVSPADYNFDESLSTLRYASRAKYIQNKPVVNEDPKDALLREYAEEIQRLKSLLESNEPIVVEKVVEIPRIHPIEEEPSLESTDRNHLNKSTERIDTQVQEELQLKEKHLQEEIHQRKNLESMLTQIQQKLITGGEALDNAEKERLKAQRQLQLRLKKQKKKEKQLLEEKRKKEEELLMKENKYQNLQEEVEDLRKVVKKLRSKYKGTAIEVQDLYHEHEEERETLFETIRSKERECDFLYKVFNYILPPGQLRNIKQRSEFDETNQEWHVPSFVLQSTKTNLPKLPSTQPREEQSSREPIVRSRGFQSPEGSAPVYRKHKQATTQDQSEDRPTTSAGKRYRSYPRRTPSKMLAPLDHKPGASETKVSRKEFSLNRITPPLPKKNPLLEPLNHQPKPFPTRESVRF